MGPRGGVLGNGIIGGYPCPKVKNHVIPPEESRDPEMAESRYTWKGSRDPLEEKGSSEKSPSPHLVREGGFRGGNNHVRSLLLLLSVISCNTDDLKLPLSL